MGCLVRKKAVEIPMAGVRKIQMDSVKHISWRVHNNVAATYKHSSSYVALSVMGDVFVVAHFQRENQVY